MAREGPKVPDFSDQYYMYLFGIQLKPQLHCHDLGPDGATTHLDL